MKKVILNISFIVLTLSMVFISGARAAITACDGSLADCQSKVNAAADRDIITIPNGSFTWNSGLNVNLSDGRALTIRGLNACTLDANGRPISCPTSISGTGGFSVTGANGKAWRISNMTLKGGIGIVATGNTRNWRIDNIYFNAPTGSALAGGRIIWAQGSGGAQTVSWGLIDHCTVYDSSAIFLHVRANSSNGGNYEWSLGAELGTANAVYLEDNTFITPTDNFYGSFLTDCEGASFVIRNSILGNNAVMNHDAIISGYRGCKKWEVYDNTFTNIVGTTLSTNFATRGGAAVAFNNTITNAPQSAPLELHLYRTYQTGGIPWNTLCGSSSGKAILDSTTTYPQNCTSGGAGCVNKDGAGTNGYPCRDQLSTQGNGAQTIIPALFWNNKLNGSFFEPTVRSGGSYYTKGVNYCSNASADKPTTCNGSAVTYTPYTYPHPYVSFPPRNLKIMK
jgi:hypothetical protein